MPQKKRKLEDFVLIEKPSWPSIGGSSAQYGELFKMKKRPIDQDKPSKSKYSHTHFVKKICRMQGLSASLPESRRVSIAIDEVRAQEFLRLMIPTQPKGRVYFDDSGQVYVSSKEIPGFKAFLEHSENKEVAKAFDPENYGTSKGFKGFGELVFFSSYVLKDSDFSSHNLGYVGLQMYKIDGGGAFTFEKSSEYVLNKLEALNEHPLFSQEVFRAYLKFIALPSSLIEKFKENYNIGSDIGERSGGNYFIKKQSFFRENFIFFEKMEEFKQYILSAEAIHDIKQYKIYLNHFILQGKKRLLDECPNALEDIDEFFLIYRNRFQEENGDKEDTAFLRERLRISDKNPSCLEEKSIDVNSFTNRFF